MKLYKIATYNYSESRFEEHEYFSDKTTATIRANEIFRQSNRFDVTIKSFELTPNLKGKKLVLALLNQTGFMVDGSIKKIYNKTIHPL